MLQYRSRLSLSSALALIIFTALLPLSSFASQPEEEDDTKVVANDSDSVQLENLIPGGDPTGDPVFDYLGGGDYGSLSGGVEVPEEGETVVTVGSDEASGGSATELYESLLSSGGFSSSSGNEDSGGGYGSGFWLNATKAREELRRLGIQKLTIRSAAQSGKSKGRALTQEELGVIAASRTLSDENIETIYVAFDRLLIDYRSLGRLFGVIPMPFTLKITIQPESLIESERIKLKYPWYKFFLRTYVSQSELRRDLNTVIETTRLEVSRTDYAADAQAALLIAVSDILKARSDAVSIN